MNSSKQEYTILGLMSGTSLDGLDAALCRFTINQNTYDFEILKAQTFDYSKELRMLLSVAHTVSSEKLNEIENTLAEFMAEKALGFIDPQSIDFVASHGHTVFHEPEKKITRQIVTPAILSALMNVKVVGDFRVQDVAMGGQGAPLVPIGDRKLFSEYAACVNLGGFANTSFEIGEERIAFDVCPVNIVLNRLVAELNLEYDEGGKLAMAGVVEDTLLASLNNLSYFNFPPPKSLGKEWVESNVLPLIDSYPQLSVQDLLATYCEHVAYQVSKVHSELNGAILFTGGGVFNHFLMSRIRDLSTFDVVIPPSEIVDFKEALIFAFLGMLRVRNEVNVLSSVTGAPYDHCAGVIVDR